MNRYDVVINGNKTTLLLSDADAKARGLTPAEAAEPADVTTKAKTPANKSRKPANKRAEIAALAFTAKPESDDQE
ncbi:MAG: hypothetical protein WD072_03405 [Pirellulales bacterium]